MLTSTLEFGSCYVNLIHDDIVIMTGGILPSWIGLSHLVASYYLLLDLSDVEFAKKTMKAQKNWCDWSVLSLNGIS